MSKLNQIQNKLRELSGGNFQKIADLYLYKKGYEKINPLGSVIGSDKVRKGTPDSFVTLPNGKYIFVEYTTQQEKLYEKLKSDLDKCFDEVKTGISVEKIEDILLCHTSNLTANEENLLAQECQKRGINLNIFGIGAISFDLYQKYPGITRNELGIEVDTGQIVTPEEFLTNYNKKAIATPLDTNFRFRQEELKTILERLEESNLVLVFGKAGVGKTKLVLESCDQFLASHPEYKIRCIFLRGPDIFEDLRIHFSEPGSYLIFVDDANRVSRFDYFIQLIHDQRLDQQIKVIATVRDYAIDKVQEIASSDKNPLEIKSLEDEQIKQLVKDEYDITNQLYLDRITKISQGNPRLAIMTAKIAKRENTLKSIFDVSSVYEEYYRSIRQDLEELGDENLLKTAGIVAYFGTVDRSNEEMMEAIETAFEIPQNLFWKMVRQLNDLELFDMYENEVVKISDQVLATYLFYLAFFKEQLLNFSLLVNNFFPRFQYRLVDVLNPVLNTFNGNHIIEVMRPHVDRVWERYKQAEDETNLMHLMEVFWFLKKTDILLYVRDCISKIEPETIELSNLEIKPNSNIPSPSLLKTLGLFSYSDENNLRMALDLLFKYLTKRPSELSQGLYIITEKFGFEHNSYAYGYPIQQTVIDVLWKSVKEGENEILSKLFFAVAEHYFPTHFNTTQMKGRRTINIIKFDLTPTTELFELRATICKRVFKLYRIPIYEEDVLNLLYKYSKLGYRIAVEQIIEQDAVEVLPFFELELKPSTYYHCCIVHNYLDLLERHNISFSKELRLGFTNETYTLSKVLLFDSYEKMSELGYDKYEQYKRQIIEEEFANYSFTKYKVFFQQCLEIHRESDRRKYNEYYFASRVVEVMLVLADRDPNLFVEVITYYLNLGEILKLNDLKIINKFIEICGVKKVHQLLNQFDYPSKRKWLFYFYRWLPSEEITSEYLEQLYSLYRESEPSEIPSDLKFLLKYCSLDKNVVIKVTEIILQKTTQNFNYSSVLSTLFDVHIEENLSLLDCFKNNVDLLKRAYLKVIKIENHADYDGEYFAYILDLDSNFIIEYIDWIYQQNEQSYHYDSTRDYSFIWRSENYEEVMSLVVNHIYEKERKLLIFTSDSRLKDYFILKADDKDNSLLQERQDKFINQMIESQYNDIDFIKFIFDVIKKFSYQRRRTLIVLFLKYNQKFEDFKKLPLENNSWGWVGSAVPVLQRHVEYFESFIPILNTVDFLEHKQHIERKIKWFKEEMEQEKKRDFMEY